MAKKSVVERWKRGGKFEVRNKNRCFLCGRPRSYIRRFRLCRICFRGLAHKGELPGVAKASW